MLRGLEPPVAAVTTVTTVTTVTAVTTVTTVTVTVTATGSAIHAGGRLQDRLPSLRHRWARE